ncbi:hypothetical protein, partial [Hymenobacter segetis]
MILDKRSTLFKLVFTAVFALCRFQLIAQSCTNLSSPVTVKSFDYETRGTGAGTADSQVSSDEQ